MESHDAGFPPFPHSLEIPSGFPHYHGLGGWLYVFSCLLNSNDSHRKGLVTDVSGPQCNACPGTLTTVVDLVGLVVAVPVCIGAVAQSDEGRNENGKSKKGNFSREIHDESPYSVKGWGWVWCFVCDYSERQLALLLVRSPMKDGTNTVRARTVVVIAKYMGRSPLSRTGAATADGKAFNFSVVGD